VEILGRLCALSAALLAIPVASPITFSQGDRNIVKPIIVLAEVQNHKVVYKVDGRPAAPDVLRVLATVGNQRGHDTPVIALVDSRAPITEIGNIDGILGKAELLKVRFFVFYNETNKMTTLELGPAIPFSDHPSWK
jgi:hypothetical protein